MSPSASGSSRSLDSTSALHSRVSGCAVAGADAIVARTVARTAAARTGRPVRKAAGRRRSMARGMARTLQVVAQLAAQVAALPGPAGGGPMDGNRLAFRPFGPQVYPSPQPLPIPGRERRSPSPLPLPRYLGGVQHYPA